MALWECGGQGSAGGMVTEVLPLKGIFSLTFSCIVFYFLAATGKKISLAMPFYHEALPSIGSETYSLLSCLDNSKLQAEMSPFSFLLFVLGVLS